MTEIERLCDLVHRSFHGEPWHGPGLEALLDGVDATRAAAKPLAGAHGIHEIVLHLTTWTEVLARRLAGENAEPVDEARDWPEPGAGAAAWREAVARLGRAHDAVERALAALTDRDLAGKAPGSSVSRYELVTGMLQHTAYHGGQVGLLRRARPAR